MTVEHTRWPPGGGEMAGRIRAHHWAATPLGPAEGWPDRLRGAVELLLAQAFPMIALWGPELVQVYNDGYRTLMGDKHPAGLGQPTQACWPEVWHINRPVYERVLAGETLTFEDRLYPVARRGPVEDAWFTLTYGPLRDGEGTVTGVLVTVFETTGRHLEEARRGQMEAALREGEARYRAFVTASSDVVYRMSPDWGEMRQLDGQGFLADTAEPTEGWMEHYIPPEDRGAVQGAIDEAIRARSTFELEHRVRRADGTVGWILSRAVPILDGRGGIAEWLGAAKDVTARRRAEDAARASEARQRFLLQLGDALRPLDDPALIQGETLRLLGGHLGVDRCFYVEADEASGHYVVRVEHLCGASPSQVGSYPPEDWPLVRKAFEAGEAIVIPDASATDRVTPGERALLEALGTGAVVAVSVVKQGRFAAALAVTQPGARPWTAEQVALLTDVAERTWTAVERARAAAALRGSEARFRGFAENSADVLWIADRGGARLEYISPAFERTFGEGRGPVVADLRRWAELVHPEDRGQALSFMPRALAGEVAIAQYRVVRPADGRVVHLRDTGFPIRDPAGAVTQVAGIVQDVTDMVRTGELLEAEKERFRTLAEGIPQLVWRSGGDGLWSWSSPQWQAFTGQDQERSHGWGWLDAIHPDDREATVRAWHGAYLHGGRLDVEHRVRRACDDTWRWHAARSVPVREAPGHDLGPGAAEGRILEWLGTMTDIEDLKRLQGQQHVLVAELQHRTRNLLGVVRSLAQSSIDPSPGRDEYDARLAALGRVQGFLSRSPLYAVALADLVKAELRAAGDGVSERVTVAGPSVALPGEGVQVVALALHELATNAVKYGAIAQPSGRLSVTWRVKDGAVGGGRLVIDWRESGIAMPDAPPARQGYGTELITEALPYQLDAETALEFGPDGVRCRIILPAGAFSGGPA